MKFATWVIGPFIVTLAGLLVPVYEPLPLPVQLPNANPLFGVADVGTVAPAL